MNEKKIDELLYRTGETMDIDELTKPCEYHTFSDSYQERMDKLRQSVMDRSGSYGTDARRKSSQKRRFPGHRWGTVAAAILLVSVLSLGVYAYYNSVHADVSQDKDKVTVTMKGLTEDSTDTAGAATQAGADSENAEGAGQAGTAGDTMSVDQVLEDLPDEGIKVPYIKITPGYLPEGYKEIEGLNRHYSIGGEYAGSGFWINQNSSRDITYRFAESFERRQIGNMEAIIINPKITDSASTYRLNILLVNPTDCVSIYIGSDTPDISLEELIKVAENLTYEATDEFIDAYAVNTIEDSPINTDYSFSPNQVVDQFTINDTDTGVMGSVKVVDVKFMDDASTLDMDNFYDAQELQNYITDTGAFKDERLRYIEDENGADVKRESADTKLMLVTMEISNTGTENIVDFSTSSYFELRQFIDEGSELRYVERPVFYDGYHGNEWCYLDNAKYTAPGENRIHSFFCIDIPKGEKRTITLGRMIYADEIDTSYLCYSPNGSAPMEKPYSENRQLIYIGDWK